MTTKEAIQAMLDGKKICREGWPSYVYFTGDCFMTKEGIQFIFSENRYYWEIYEEPKPKKTVVIEKWLVKTAFNVGFKVIEASVEFIESHYSDADKVKLLKTYEVEL